MLLFSLRVGREELTPLVACVGKESGDGRTADQPKKTKTTFY
jgi:hypothetical protein